MRIASTRAISLALALSCGSALAATSTSVQMSKQSLVTCADAGVAECQFQLGEITERGDGVSKDTATAKQLYELAYKNGYEPAGAAVLRLTRSGATNGVVPPPLSPPAYSVSNATPPTRMNSAVVTSSPNSWGIVAEKGGAPRVAGIGLGDSESTFSNAVPSAVCETKKTLPETRSCSGRIANGDVEVDAQFFHNALYSLSFQAVVPVSVCNQLEEQLKPLLGRTSHGFVSGLISMAMPGNARIWSNKKWMVASACVAVSGEAPEADLLVTDLITSNQVKD